MAKLKATRGTRHDYLGMTIDFATKDKVVIDMCDYIKNMLADSSVILKPDESWRQLQIICLL